MIKKNILYCSFIFFIVTIFFQIAVLIKLNQYDKKINRVASGITSNEKPPEQPEEPDTPSKVPDMEPSATETSGFTNYEDIDEVLSPARLTQTLTGSLFIGDSRTEGLYKFTPAAGYADFHCGVGYTVSTVKDNPQLSAAIAEKKYSRIFLCLGYNELGWDYPETFISRYAEFIQFIKDNSPDTRIYVIAVLNVCRESHNLEEYENNDRILQYNNLLSEMCQNSQVTYLDLNGYFTDSNGNLNPVSTEDGIHFTAVYYNYYLYQIIEASISHAG